MIHNPQSGGTHLPALTNPAGAGQILSGYQAINADGEIVTGSIPSQGAQTITPGTVNKTIAAGRYLSGTQTIAGDSDLIGSNIKSGVNLFGVDGTLVADTQVSGTIINKYSNDVAIYYTAASGTDDATSIRALIGAGETETITVKRNSILVVNRRYTASTVNLIRLGLLLDSIVFAIGRNGFSVVISD